MVTEVVKIILQNRHKNLIIDDEFWKDKSLTKESKKLFPSITKLTKKYPIDQLKKAASLYYQEKFSYPYFEAIVKRIYKENLNKEKTFSIDDKQNKQPKYKFEKANKAAIIDFLKGLENGKR